MAKGRPTEEVQDAFVGLRINKDFLDEITKGSDNVSATIKEILKSKTKKAEPMALGKELKSILDFYHISLEEFMKVLEKSLHDGTIAYDGKVLYGVGEVDTREFVIICKALKKNPQTVLDAYATTIRR